MMNRTEMYQAANAPNMAYRLHFHKAPRRLGYVAAILVEPTPNGFIWADIFKKAPGECTIYIHGVCTPHKVRQAFKEARERLVAGGFINDEAPLHQWDYGVAA